MKTASRILSVLIVILMALCAVIPAAAAGYVDVDRTGEVTFKITSSDSENEPIGGGSIALYKVATVDKYGVYTLLPEFATLDVDVNALEDTDESWSGAAEGIALYIKNHSLEDTARIIEINQHGQASVTGLTTGLYVALQNEAPKGYNPFKPFIIPMPYTDENGQFNYILTAYPKGTSHIPAEDCVIALPVILKTVSGDGAPVDTEFRFRVEIYEKEGNYPALVNSTGSVETGGNIVSQTENEIVLQISGQGSAEIGTVTFDHPGRYVFTVSEINTGALNYMFDKTVYSVEYTVDLNADETKLVVTNILFTYDNVNGEVIYEGEGPLMEALDFNNIYNPPKPPDSDDSSDSQSESETETDTTPPTDSSDSSSDSSSDTDTTKPPESSDKSTTTNGGSSSSSPGGNSKNNGGSTPSSPQTGQVWWPAMFLAAAGVFFIICGIIVSKRSRRRNRDE